MLRPGTSLKSTRCSCFGSIWNTGPSIIHTCCPPRDIRPFPLHHTPQTRSEQTLGPTLTWHCEVLSVYDLVLSVVELIVVLLCVAVQVLQVGHHRHAPPRIPALCAGGDGHGRLRRRVFLTHPAGENRHEDNDINPEPGIGDNMFNSKSLACVALFSVWKTSLQGRTQAFLHGNKITNTVERPQHCQIKLEKKAVLKN